MGERKQGSDSIDCCCIELNWGTFLPTSPCSFCNSALANHLADYVILGRPFLYGALRYTPFPQSVPKGPDPKAKRASRPASQPRRKAHSALSHCTRNCNSARLPLSCPSLNLARKKQFIYFGGAQSVLYYYFLTVFCFTKSQKTLWDNKKRGERMRKAICVSLDRSGASS